MTNADTELHLADLMAEIADDFRNRRTRGENPDPEEYAARYPQAARQIRDILSIILSAEPALANQSLTIDTIATGRLGDFRLGREVGRGGMGVVYEATQISLGRRVALKVLPFAALVDPRILKRFQNEARAAAVLDHPHVVKVHAVGQDRGVHFIAMQFIDGRPLSELSRAIHPVVQSSDLSRTTPIVPTNGGRDVDPSTAPVAQFSTLPAVHTVEFFHWVAELGAQAADALEHAHSLGVVHRDVKPSNLLFDGQGALWVSDFGLAKVASLDAGVTMTGDVFGTLRYMSPEQALAKHDLVDHRTDIYSLGATLYELLAGRAVVEGSDKAEILRTITDAEPLTLRQLNLGIPKDLETVIHKCLRKDAADRYESARNLAEDLRSFLCSEPVKARPIGRVNRTWRRIVRRPLVVGLAAATFFTASIALGLGLWAAYQRERSRNAEAHGELVEFYHRAEQAQKDLELKAAKEREERHRFHATLERVRQRRAEPRLGWTSRNLADLNELSRLGPATDFAADLRSELASALSAVDLRPAGMIGEGISSYGVDYSPDGRLIAIGDRRTDPAGNCCVRIYDTMDGQVVVKRLRPDPGQAAFFKNFNRTNGVRCVRFSPGNGRWLAAGMVDGRLARWDMQNPDAEPWFSADHRRDATDPARAFMRSIAFSSDCLTVISSAELCVRGWNISDGTVKFVAELSRMQWDSPPFADRTLVTTWDEHGEKFGWLDVATGTVRDAGVNECGGGAVAPSGHLLAYVQPWTGALFLKSAFPGAIATAVSTNTGIPLRLRGDPRQTFCDSGTLLVSIDEDEHRYFVTDIASSRLAVEGSTPIGLTGARFAPDGRRLALTTMLGTVLFDITSRVLETIGPIDELSVHAMAAPSDHSKVIATVRDSGIDQKLYQWAIGTDGHFHQPEERRLDLKREPFLPLVDFSPDGSRFIYTGHVSRPPGPHLKGVVDVSDGDRWMPDHFHTACFGSDGRLWLMDNHELQQLLAGHKYLVVWKNDAISEQAGMLIRSIAGGRKYLLAGRRDGMLFRIDTARMTASNWQVSSGALDAVAISSDDSRGSVGDENGLVALIDLETGKITSIPEAHSAPVRSIASGPGFLATGSADSTVRLWFADGRPLATLRMNGPVRKVLLSEDGRSLLVHIEGERAVRRWRMDLLFREWQAMGLGDGLPPLRSLKSE
jgi:serine/threonine protein kinase/WD40 repeat protein